MVRMVLAGLLLLAAPAGAQDATGFASAADVRAQVATMARDLKPGQTFLWRPLVKADGSVAALEYWTAPAAPAVHPDEAEYATVVAGSGELVSGGTLIDPVEKQPGLIEGRRIDGGTRRSLRPGDVFLIPPGTPHWFGIGDGGRTKGARLVLLGTKIRR